MKWAHIYDNNYFFSATLNNAREICEEVFKKKKEKKETEMKKLSRKLLVRLALWSVGTQRGSPASPGLREEGDTGALFWQRVRSVGLDVGARGAERGPSGLGSPCFRCGLPGRGGAGHWLGSRRLQSP